MNGGECIFSTGEEKRRREENGEKTDKVKVAGCLNNPHRQMRTLYVFHNTQMLYSIIRHFANSTLQIAANLIIIYELRSIPPTFST